ncbi:MAG: glycoside hydrolase family 9 protein [Phycisphaeraceae bacterium]|nr:glycoside hydrolase family 9 protein [Phycisphaeraceae bacterium]
MISGRAWAWFVLLAVTSAMADSSNLLGQWEISYQFGDQPRIVTLQFQRGPSGGLEGTWSAARGELPLENVQLAGDALTFQQREQVRGNERITSFLGRRGDDCYEGMLSRGQDVVPAVIRRRPPIGEWLVTYQRTSREDTITLRIGRGLDGQLTGQWISERGVDELSNVTFSHNQLTFERVRNWGGGDRGYSTLFEGNLEDGQIVGTVTSLRGRSPFVARPLSDWFSPDVGADEPIRLNSVGYLPDAMKVASISSADERFSVVRAEDGQTVYEGTISGPFENVDTHERLYFADFSAVTEPGTYQLSIDDLGRSAPFRIAADVYDQPLQLTVTAMSLWRCGQAVRFEYQDDVFEHPPCHMEDAWTDYVAAGHEWSDATGGWHDAGDYNKYVIDASFSVGSMLRAWEMFSDHLRDLVLPIPESADPLPDYLSEIKWELDWLLKMQAPDGSVYLKVSTLNYGPFVLPQDETTPRHLAPGGTTATAGFVAATAMASRIYRPYDEAFAERLLAAARRSYDFLQQKQQYTEADQSMFLTTAYDSHDSDDRTWAVAELWQSTGDQAYLDQLEADLGRMTRKIDSQFDWDNVSNMAVLTYLLSQRSDRNEQIVTQCRDDLLAAADTLVQQAASHGYARPLREESSWDDGGPGMYRGGGMGGYRRNSYEWGGNGMVARQCMLLQTALHLEPQRTQYRDTALDALNHLFGRNVYGRSFVTGLGHRPPLHPHDRRSASDAVDKPWPGYLIGGPHPTAMDWNDQTDDYATNDIAINWNAALIYALAAFAK